MSFGKRISTWRERSAQARAKRREERRRAERAKAGATAAERAKARSERRAVAEAQRTRSKAEAGRRERPTARSRATAKPASKPGAAKPASKARVGGPLSSLKASTAGALSKLTASKRGRALFGEARKLGAGAASIGGEILKLAREMVAIPVQLWLTAAEFAGAWVLKAWLRAVRPLVLAVWRLALAGFRLAERHLTPARTVFVVSLVAVGALAASQWLDYHSVSVGTDAYAGAVGEVAPAPQVESEIAGNAHAWVMLPLALAAVVALVVSLTVRRRAAALLVAIGVAVIAISLIVDVPKGLDEGSAAVAYQGASASLLEGFWMQIATAVVLIACGLLLPRYLRPAAATAAPAGPTLFQTLAAAARKQSRRRPSVKRKLPSLRGKRKVQGAGL